MQVVAYTASPIKLAILRLFVRCDVVLPNAFIGTLTRESVTDALKSGIDHEQIVRYLTEHADPHVAGNVPIVPAVSLITDLRKLCRRRPATVACMSKDCHVHEARNLEDCLHVPPCLAM